ncbi:hypothetical protein ACQZ4X_04545 [Agrobacterium vitis]
MPVGKKSRLLVALWIACVDAGLTSSAYAYPVYRGVTAAPNGVVSWVKENFGVSGAPTPTLSFFHYPDDITARAQMSDAQCFVKVELGALVNLAAGMQIQVGNQDVVFNVNAADNPRAFPWNIVFDDDPAGHWSIARAEIQNPQSTNAAASRVAAAGFQSLAAGGLGVTVINGHQENCRVQ